MDYAVLSGGLPSKRLISYFIPGLEYCNSLPRFMRDHGYHTVSLHGASGDFFNRRTNFEQMSWDDILFKEDFKGMSMEQSHWGVRDEGILTLSSRKMHGATGPVFHFIITLDTHGPFNLISEEEKTIFPGSRVSQENYFNSMSVLDRNLRNYIASLPSGTLVLLYGDHTAGVEHQGFSPAREVGVDVFPA